MNILPHLPDTRNGMPATRNDASPVVPVSPVSDSSMREESPPQQPFVTDVEEREKVLSEYAVVGPQASLFSKHDEQTRKALSAYQNVSTQTERGYVERVFNLDVFA